jgi:hypothetical protein
MKTFGFVAAMFAGMALAHATTNFKILPPFLQTGR